MMLFKKGVKREGVQYQIWYAIGVAEMIFRANGQKLVITSLTDGTHMVNSCHAKGLAMDIRTKGVPSDMLMTLFNALKRTLDPLGYDTIVEKDHIHSEFDPKIGEIFSMEVE